MKVIKVLMAVALLLILTATPAEAFTMPTVNAENVTDVMLWVGDNLTLQSVTVNGQLSGSANLTGNVTSDIILTGEVTIVGLTDSLEDIAASFLAFLMVVFFIILVIIKRSIVLTGLACPVALVYGLLFASNQTVYSAEWVSGVAIAVLGIYFLYEVAAFKVKKQVKHG